MASVYQDLGNVDHAAEMGLSYDEWLETAAMEAAMDQGDVLGD